MPRDTENSLQAHCECGAPLTSTYNERGPKWRYGTYACGTDRVAKGTPAFDDGGRVDRSEMCKYAHALRITAMLAPPAARQVWEAVNG